MWFATYNLHLDTVCWGDLSLDGKRYFVAAGIRVQHDKQVLVVLRILSDQGTEFVNQDFKKHARLRGIHLSTSPAQQPQNNGIAERLVGLAKQCTRRPLLASNLPDIYWSYAVRFAAETTTLIAKGTDVRNPELVSGLQPRSQDCSKIVYDYPNFTVHG